MSIGRVYIGTIGQIEAKTPSDFGSPEVCADHAEVIDRRALVIMGSRSIDSTVIKDSLEKNQILFTERMPEPAHSHGDVMVYNPGHWFVLDKAVLGDEQGRQRLISAGRMAVDISESELDDGATLVILQ